MVWWDSRRAGITSGPARLRFSYGLVLAAALLGLLLGHSTGVALATNVGSNTTSGGTAAHPCDTTIHSQCIANDDTHTVWLNSSLDAGMQAAVRTAISTYQFVDDIVVVEWTSSNADARMTQGDYKNTSWWAYGHCIVGATYGGSDPNRWCSPQQVTFNVTHPVNWDSTAGGRNAVACHELGHTLGLRHAISTQSSCMRNAQTTYTGITTHDEAMLNGIYP
jgi:hypothetical protein